ncbi:hypothetical protein BX600DRAFT_506511 [Xylariales sp. PMI_506]|nr:hypothetical protein BX600DRAFT_506511 [Xylariales sp. PMI_506]
MSGEGPESIPTSADPRSKRPVKKRALTPVSAQSSSIEALFARPDQEIRIPTGAGASSSAGRRHGALPPEIVTNVQGSSAGAGSGEFHVYKASRRREYERLRRMDEELARERNDEDFERLREERERRDEGKTRRNREKREKMKARKAKAKVGAAGGDGEGGKTNSDIAAAVAAPGVKAPRITLSRPSDNNNGGGEDRGEDADVQGAPSTVEEPKGIVIEED